MHESSRGNRAIGLQVAGAAQPQGIHMTRDMSKREFDEACKRHGLRAEGFLGYYAFNLPTGGQCCVSKWNAGPTRREQLAYLIQQKDKALAAKVQPVQS